MINQERYDELEPYLLKDYQDIHVYITLDYAVMKEDYCIKIHKRWTVEQLIGFFDTYEDAFLIASTLALKNNARLIITFAAQTKAKDNGPE